MADFNKNYITATEAREWLADIGVPCATNQSMMASLKGSGVTVVKFGGRYFVDATALKELFAYAE